MKPEEAKRLARRSRAAGGRGDRSRSREPVENQPLEDRARGSEEQREGAEAADEVRENAALAEQLRDQRRREGAAEDADEKVENEVLADEEYNAEADREEKEEGMGEEGGESEVKEPRSGDDSYQTEDDDYQTRDYWERQGNLLIRRHVAKRTLLFDPLDMVNGYRTEDWNLGHARRSRIITLGGSMALIDDEWRVHRGINPGYGWWTGSTTFIVGRAIDEENAEEEGDDDQPPEEGGESQDGEEADDDEEEEGREDRGAGGARESDSDDFSGRRSVAEPEPEEGYQAPNDEAKKCAEDYVEKVQKGFCNSVDDWLELVGIGNRLLAAAGTVEEAAKSLWQVREERGLANLAGVKDKRLDGVLHPDLLAYLRDVRGRGMAARFQGPRARVRTRLHPNARKNLDQVFRQIAKDVGKHRVLLVGSEHSGLCHTVCSPFETVAKMNPDRTVSSEQRLVHDQRGINAGTSKYLHPPAVQPSHAQVARRILWHKVRCPNVPILMSKKDIAGAFRLLWVDPSDVELFAGDLPWKAEAFDDGWRDDPVCRGGVTVLYLVSSFGFSGSPGEWTAWGRATEEFHRGFRPYRGAGGTFLWALMRRCSSMIVCWSNPM